MNLFPSEFAFGGIYFAPLLSAFSMGLILAWLTAQTLNRYRLSRFFLFPPLVLLAFAVIYTVLIGTFVTPS